MTYGYERDPAILTPVERLTRDIANAAITLSDVEARFLVDNYYVLQDARIRADGQIRSMVKHPVETGEVDPKTGEPIKAVEPHAVLDWLSVQSSVLEGQLKRALTKYIEVHPMFPWLDSIYGIGPVISAGLVANIDITEAETAGDIWRFAGLDPTSKWEKKTKRPWNAGLKVVCYKAGESFVKFHNEEECHYGHMYRKQKDEVYTSRNNAGLYAERSKLILKEKNYKKTTDAYKAYSQGRFPPAHIHAMARRWTVKRFISDFQAVWWFVHHKKITPKPWIIEHGGHAHYEEPYHIEIVPGMLEAYRAAKP